MENNVKLIRIQSKDKSVLQNLFQCVQERKQE